MSQCVCRAGSWLMEGTIWFKDKIGSCKRYFQYMYKISVYHSNVVLVNSYQPI